jgi:hypothetical protein
VADSARKSAYDARRPSARERGYDTRWGVTALTDQLALARGTQPRLTLEPADPIPTLESALATLEIA